jgi:alcohol dehydrogenase (cytochrome c)
MKRFHLLALLVIVVVAGLATTLLAQQAAQKPFVPIQDELLWKPDPADWLSWRRTLDGQGFSPLTEINRNNVRQLRLMWTKPITGNQNESTPLVYKGVMYVPNSGDIIQAYDAKSGNLLWEYKRPSAGGMRNRTMAIWGTTLIDGSGDNQIYAIDAQTGKLVWETAVLPPKAPASATGGPIIANGKVIEGRQCQPAATTDACIITAHDAKTGKEVWRFRTIPRPGEPGYETWGDVPENERWHVGTWMVPSYDPETNLVIVGAGRQRQAAPVSQLNAGH